MVDPPTESQKKLIRGVVNEPQRGISHLTIQLPTINVDWLCSCVVQSFVLWLYTDCINNVVILDFLAIILSLCLANKVAATTLICNHF